MEYSFDIFGWLSDSLIEGRTTEVAPPEHGEKIIGELYPNYVGVEGREWMMMPYTEPGPSVAEQVSDPVFVPYEVTPFQFKMRFTPEERIECRRMAKINDEVYDLMDMLNSTATPTLNDPMMIWGVNKLEEIGLLGPGRAAKILEIPSSQG